MALIIDNTVISRPRRTATTPSTTQTKKWEASYAAADAGSAGVTPTKKPASKPAVQNPRQADLAAHLLALNTTPTTTPPAPTVTSAPIVSFTAQSPDPAPSTEPSPRPPFAEEPGPTIELPNAENGYGGLFPVPASPPAGGTNAGISEADRAKQERADARALAANDAGEDPQHIINPRTGRGYTDAELKALVEERGPTTPAQTTNPAPIRTPEEPDPIKTADARALAINDSGGDPQHIINPRTGRGYTDAELRGLVDERAANADAQALAANEAGQDPQHIINPRTGRGYTDAELRGLVEEQATNADERALAVLDAGGDPQHIINPRTGRGYTDAELRDLVDNRADSEPPAPESAQARRIAQQEYIEAQNADARAIAAADAGGDYDHIINPRTGRGYTDGEVTYARETRSYRAGLSPDERIEFDNLFYEVGVDFDKDDAVGVIGRDWHEVFNTDGSGVQQDDLVAIANDNTGFYSPEQRAAAHYLLSRPGDFNTIESNQSPRYSPVHDGAIGEDNIINAGGEIGPSREELIEAGKENLRSEAENGDITSSDLSTGLTVLDSASELSPGEFAILRKTLFAGQVGVALYQAANGDTDQAFETAFDTLVPIAATKILAAMGAGSAAGPVGAALALILALAPLDTSDTRVAAFSENSGEIDSRGRRNYPGAHGTMVNGNGFADPMFR